jgi:hypothetical protein
VQAFKKECQDSALYAGYSSLEQFRLDFKRHLELELNHAKYRWLQVAEATGPEVVREQISSDALRLLRVAERDDGTLMYSESLSGTGLRAGNEEFIDDSPRSAAKWRGILNGLVGQGAVENIEGGLYRLTESGYALVDDAAAKEKASKPTNLTLDVSGPPEAQILHLRSDRKLHLVQLDFLTPTGACISSQPVSQEGADIKVPLDHRKVIELFNSPRTDRNHYDFSGPAKLRAMIKVNDLQHQATLDVMLLPKIVNNTQWVTLTGSSSIQIPPTP